MAAKKNTNTEVTNSSTNTEPMFSKEQIVASEKYANRRDLVDALLVDGKKYTMKEVDRLVDNYRKGKVN